MGRRTTLTLYIVALLLVLLLFLIGTTPQAMADPNNWINLTFWGIVLVVVAILFVRTLMKKPGTKPPSVAPSSAS